MERILSAIVLVVLAGVLTGCGDDVRTEADTPKISEITNSMEEENRPVSAGFYVYFFEIDANEFDLISESLADLNDPDMKLTVPGVFSDNGFIIAAGQRSDWTELGAKLLLVQARKISTISLMLYENISDDIAVSSLKDANSVFCKVADNKFLNLKLGPGQSRLRLRISGLIGLLGVCRVDVTPVFVPGRMRSDDRFIRNKLAGETVFNGSALNFRIRPGQFVLIAPGDYEPQRRTLSGMFFSSKKPRPTVRVMLLACNVIRE